MPGAPTVPDAWPALMNIRQLCAYLGETSWDTVKRVLPVAPVDLGANVLRYRKVEVDRWIDGLPIRSRLKEPQQGADDAPSGEVVDLSSDDRRTAALDRVRRRAEGTDRWRKKTA